MTWDEYNRLFHKLHLNRVAFKPLFECDKEVLSLINAAIDEEREQMKKEGWRQCAVGQKTTQFCGVAAEKDKEVERLRKALKKYGKHLSDCAFVNGGYQCTCGFNQQGQPQ